VQHPLLIDPARIEPGTYEFRVRRSFDFYGKNFKPGEVMSIDPAKDSIKLQKALVLSSAQSGVLSLRAIKSKESTRKPRKPRAKATSSTPPKKSLPEVEVIPTDV
jgi:hypothetical protein